MVMPARALEDISHGVYSFTTEIAEAINNYEPEAPPRLWNDAVQQFTRSAITDFAPISIGEARKAMSAVAHLAIWIVDVACEELDRETVFNGQIIDAYITSATIDKKADTRRLLRLRLLRIAAELEEFDPARRERRRKLGPEPAISGFLPYTPAQITRFRNQGATRSTEQRRHNWMVVLALAAGCALSATEIVYLRTADVEDAGTFIEVTVRGKKPRTVICLADWEEDIRNALASPLAGEFLLAVVYEREHSGEGDPMTGRPALPSAFVGTLIRKAGDDVAARFSVERLRSSWILAHLEARTNPASLLQAVGDKSLGSFTRLIPYLREPDGDDFIAMFRGTAAQ